jgi:hypothetical protein
VGPRLVSRLIREGGGKGATPPSAITPTQGLIEASRAIFFSYADSEDNSRMSRRAVETFLRDINGVATRGSESRKANEILHGKEAKGGGAEGDVMYGRCFLLFPSSARLTHNTTGSLRRTCSRCGSGSWSRASACGRSDGRSGGTSEAS